MGIACRQRLKDPFRPWPKPGASRRRLMQLVVSQPAISKAIAEMKHALGALPFDHSAHSVGLAECGPQLVERGRIIFDEIKQGATKIEELCDPP